MQEASRNFVRHLVKGVDVAGALVCCLMLIGDQNISANIWIVPASFPDRGEMAAIRLRYATYNDTLREMTAYNSNWAGGVSVASNGSANNTTAAVGGNYSW